MYKKKEGRGGKPKKICRVDHKMTTLPEGKISNGRFRIYYIVSVFLWISLKLIFARFPKTRRCKVSRGRVKSGGRFRRFRPKRLHSNYERSLSWNDGPTSIP